MKASDIMNTPIVGASPDASAREVALYMLLGGFSGVPIMELGGEVVGIVTELDLLRAIRAGRSLEQTLVSEIMTRGVVTVEASTPVEEIMAILDSERILRVPVMNEGKLVGIVSRPDLLRQAVQPHFLRAG
jgi:CBS domain-containing protein